MVWFLVIFIIADWYDLLGVFIKDNYNTRYWMFALVVH
jgi:hypothetical protein